MDRQPSGDCPSTSGSQRKARKRPWDSGKGPPSPGPSEKLSCPPTQPDAPQPGASADGSCESVDQDSESSARDTATLQKSPTNYEEHPVPISLSAMKSLNGCIVGETLDFRLPCTATENTTCQIVNHLSAWNEFFFLVSLQLQEMPGAGRKLCLVFTEEPGRTQCSPRNLRLVTLLLCELLRAHRCVAHIDLEVSLFSTYRMLLSDALWECPSITSLTLAYCYEKPVEDFAVVALSMPRLQKLQYVGKAKYWPTCVARIPALLQTTTSLTILNVSSDCLSGLNVEKFFRALAQNGSLKELALPTSLVSRMTLSVEAVFAEWLTKSVSLTSLTVSPDCRLYKSLKCILKGLVGNRSIVDVDCECPAMDKTDFQLLSKIFEQNRVLRRCRITNISDPFSRNTFSYGQGPPDQGECERCLKALVENQTLEEVTLPLNVWDEGQWRELFEALPAKRNLKTLSIDGLRQAPQPALSRLCAALKVTGADEKVSVSTAFTEEDFDERFDCKAFWSLVVRDSDYNSATVHKILERLPSLGHITYFHLDFHVRYEMDELRSSALATFLAATRTLQTLSLSASWDAFPHHCQKALLDGLAANKSLREVRMFVSGTRRDFSEFSEPLADVVNASRNISWVHLAVGGAESRGNAFLRRLSAGIANNYTLLSATAFEFMDTNLKRPWFEVLDAIRRNCGLLSGAADFARGAQHDSHCAQALERMQGHPELVEQVVKLEGVDQAQAATTIRQGLRCLEGMDMHEFMRFAGVVRGRVSCRAREDGSTQLDDLNGDCWRALRSYLKLYHIKDSTAGALPQQ